MPTYIDACTETEQLRMKKLLYMTRILYPRHKCTQAAAKAICIPARCIAARSKTQLCKRSIGVREGGREGNTQLLNSCSSSAKAPAVALQSWRPQLTGHGSARSSSMRLHSMPMRLTGRLISAVCTCADRISTLMNEELSRRASLLRATLLLPS